jgi:hypothetical protein
MRTEINIRLQNDDYVKAEVSGRPEEIQAFVQCLINAVRLLKPPEEA